MMGVMDGKMIENFTFGARREIETGFLRRYWYLNRDLVKKPGFWIPLDGER